ncbi:MAG: PhzF family phenazine biosynthesis protein [Acidimicrobiia bacterium]
MSRRFRLVDVFGERSLQGNPLAVVIDSDGLSTDEMLEITRWLGFSETTFLGPPETPDADYRVRIFTLAGELPFAGHPTLGTCHVWADLSADEPPEMTQECGAGLVRLRRRDGLLSFEAPPLIRQGPVDEDDLARFTAVLGIDRSAVVSASWVDNGPGWVGLLLGDADAVLALEPDVSRDTGEGPLDIGVVGKYPAGSGRAVEVRGFFSDDMGHLREDPVTGSLNASLAQWLVGEGILPGSYVAGQGTRVGRRGRVVVETDDVGGIWIGGRVSDVVTGHI